MSPGEDNPLGPLEESHDANSRSSRDAHESTSKLCDKISVMEPILRFLQLLCENHNLNLQVKHGRKLRL